MPAIIILFRSEMGGDGTPPLQITGVGSRHHRIGFQVIVGGGFHAAPQAVHYFYEVTHRYCCIIGMVGVFGVFFLCAPTYKLKKYGMVKLYQFLLLEISLREMERQRE